LAGEAATPPEGGKQPALTGMSAASIFGKSLPEENIIGSPLKKARPSISDIGDLKPGMFPPALGDILAKAEAAQAAQDKSKSAPAAVGGQIEEEEL
jgi:hypothetical protein